MARQPDTPPPPPAVQKLRLRYAKRSRLRFSSHRDFQRALERALRRCDVPMAYSAGFTPHPKISYAGAAPTGAASEAEFCEISVTHRCSPAQLRRALDDAMPDGLDIDEVVEVRSAGALADRLTGSVWEIVLLGVRADQARMAVTALLAMDVVRVERRTKTGRRELDVRSAIVSCDLVSEGTERSELARLARLAPQPCAIIQLVVRHTTPTVRPDDVLTALRTVAGLAPAPAHQATRLAQGLLDAEAGIVADPLAADRDVIGD